LRSGNGKYETLSYVYEGMWKQDLMDGPGTLTDKLNNSVFSGIMKEG